MAVISISVPPCAIKFNYGAIEFSSQIEAEQTVDFVNNNFEYYFVSPDDGNEILFFQYIPLRQIGAALEVYGDINVENILAVVKKHGFTHYTLIAKVVDKQGVIEPITLTRQQVQFTDIDPVIDVLSVSAENNIAEVVLNAEFWNEEHLQLSVRLDDFAQSFPVMFEWQPENQLWRGRATFSTLVGVCDIPIKLTLVGGCREGSEALPCRCWNLIESIPETVPGGCMNTSYQTGLHIFNDHDGNDYTGSVVKTAASSHLVASFAALRNQANYSVYVRVLSRTGALTPAILLPDVTDNDQKDPDLAPVCGTDDFVAVWASNAVGGAFRVYARRFSVGEDGRPAATSASIQISQSNGDYVAPRLVYNKAIDKFFVTWISVADRSIQSVYLNNDPQLSPAGYQSSHQETISPEYYVADLNISNSNTLSISVFNAADKVIAAYKLSSTTVIIYQYAFEAGTAPNPVELPRYEVADIRNFHFAFDETDSKLKIVFVNSLDDHVFGDTIAYFGAGSVTGSVKATPIPLNQGNYTCDRPYIKRTPVNLNGQRNFIVAWETLEHGTFYNQFDRNYSQLYSEVEINPGNTNTDKPRVIVTDNQLALVVQSDYLEASALAGTGILYYAAQR